MPTNNLKLNHYTYKISFQSGHFYFGVRSCECLPEEDSNYLGSPETHKNYWENFISCKTILGTFETREEANEHENVLIQWGWDVCKELSLNGHISNIKFHRLGIPHSEEEILRRSQSYLLISPTGQIVEGKNVSAFAKEHNLDKSAVFEVLKGKKLHVKGWTASLTAYKIYLEAYKDRGIWDTQWNKTWGVSSMIRGVSETRRFKTKREAIIYRDYLEKQGHVFKIVLQNWKARLAELLK